MTTYTTRWLMLAAIAIACSACTERTTTATFITPASQQITAIKWDEATAATTSAKVNNTSLIFMR